MNNIIHILSEAKLNHQLFHNFSASISTTMSHIDNKDEEQLPPRDKQIK
jgi:hypothetical protein